MLPFLEVQQRNAHHLRQGLEVSGVLCDARQMLDGGVQSPHREDIGNGVTSLVGRAEYGVRGPRSAFIIPISYQSHVQAIQHVHNLRNSRVALQAVEQHVKAGADMQFCME